MVRHNNVLPNTHLKKQWQRRVKTWFDQPGRKKRRRLARERKAKLMAPNPTHKLRPVVRGQTNKYNSKVRLGRGFTEQELKLAGLPSVQFARSIGIAIDSRRQNKSKEPQDLNVQRLKEYLSKIILYPRHEDKPAKKPLVKEANKTELAQPEAKDQNKTKCVIPLPKPETPYEFAPVTKEMKEKNVFKVQRHEIKEAKGFYKRLEKIKGKK